jgi:OOP family OmpA-OmpF porin
VTTTVKNRIFGAVLALMAATAAAQQGEGNPTAAEIIERLAPRSAEAQPGLRTRSMRNLQPVARLIDLNVQFEFDSAVIRPDARATLEQLRFALQSPRLAGVSFRVEGHTDAVGSADYNMTLSQRRANAVVEYLAGEGIDKARLMPLGKGFSELANPEDPLAPENRRVRIRALDR